MAKRPIRIFQIAKELNISHTEILSFLKGEGIEVGSHMSPVDESVYQKILAEFSKDKENVERYRKEQVRREIHDDRVRQEVRTGKKLKLLSLEDQRSIEKEEEIRAKKEAEEERKRREEERLRKEEEAQRKAEEQTGKKEAAEQESLKTADKPVTEKPAEKKAKARKPEPQKVSQSSKKTGAKPKSVKGEKPSPKTEKIESKKRKLRKIDLSEIQAEIGSSSGRKGKKKPRKDEKVQKDAKERVRQTLASMEKGKSSRKKSHKREKTSRRQESVEEETMAFKIPEFSSVDELSNIFDTSPSEIIQKCISLGVLATINQRLEWDVIALLAEEYGYIAEQQSEAGDDLYSLENTEEDVEKAEPRAPVVTVMGHVDHGKTSLLDYVRKTNVVAGESGGITQHIGAYRVVLDSGQSITFLDTPGHEAFTAMRARGAKVTDIVVLVVAADDAVMPQTIEAINHAQAAGVPMIIAINKIDKPGADIDTVKRELSEKNVLVENWGGKVQSINVSAKTGEGIDDLLNSIILEAEILELKANRDTTARGTVVDSRLDRGHGPVATVLIQKGVLKVGDPFICSDFSGKVRAIMNERGQRIEEAGPSDAVQVLGFEQVPQAADIFTVVDDEKDLKRISSERQRISREIAHKKISTHSLDAMSAMIKEGTMKQLPLVIKGDVDGSVEALSETLEKLNTEEVGVNIIHKAVGMISESDVLLAEASDAVIIGFNVQVQSNATLQAKQSGVEIRSYSVIYNAVEDLKLALEGLLEPDKVEEIVGRAEVQAQFKIPKIGFIAGAKVTEGNIVRNGKARLLRDDEIIAEGVVSSLKRFKDDAKEVKEGLECGIGIDGVNKYEEGDIIELYAVKEIKRTLETH